MKYKLAGILLLILAALITLFINALKILVVVGVVAAVGYGIYRLTHK